MALPYIGLLLGMQASGMIIDYQQTKRNKQLIDTGRQLEQAAFESNMESLQVESGEQSLQEMKQLRQNIGTQIAVNAARGTVTASQTNQSVANFTADERSRRFNLLAKESQLRAHNVLSGLHTLQSETQLGQAMTNRFMQSIPVSSAVKEFRGTDFAKKWGFGESK